MRKLKLPLLALLVFTAACKKENSSTTGSNVSNAQAADIAATTLASSSNGVSGITLDASVNTHIWVNTNLTCGSTKTDSLTRQSAPGATTTYSYKSKYSNTLNCNGNSQPDNILSNVTYSGSFNGPRVSSTYTGSSLFTLGGLTSAATSYIINGELKRNGTFQSKVENKNADTSSVDIVFKSVNIPKSTGIIASGNATITITGATSQNGSFAYNGTVVFNNDGTATLTLNGTVYLVNLVTGETKRK